MQSLQKGHPYGILWWQYVAMSLCPFLVPELVGIWVMDVPGGDGPKPLGQNHSMRHEVLHQHALRMFALPHPVAGTMIGMRYIGALSIYIV